MASQRRWSRSSPRCTENVAERNGGGPHPQSDEPVVLHPGELWFGESPTCVRTLLGSCVAITLWHPQRRIGGMCHYLLSGQMEQARHNGRPGYYATGAIRYFQKAIRSWQTRPQDYEVKMFGGGNMFPDVERHGEQFTVAESNIRHGQHLLENAGFSIKARDLGGVRYRIILLELDSGDVWVRYGHNSRSTP